ncbi:hypothetical protein [Clostridium algidicarnis]|uniref:hypothetical protein n=1 Tax=Clostridium algidicarnis TaxID=37659 RepID=UPI001C0C09C7|nr:hypothetical protein [Clostridium algidicarnis]MBU3196550.1 hypothetical protein [Clostridium algidicarnis]MBU3209903.1 hypothetical protein [Clostridium algidicarnis]MBU3228441.1 hypothetical protein [Clostridium algidicarnis]MBU3252184.1 hypothetical protein [Clostridium algidicarnis]
MKTNKDEIFKFIEDSVDADKKVLWAGEIGKKLNLQRSNVSSILNEVHRDRRCCFIL